VELSRRDFLKISGAGAAGAAAAVALSTIPDESALAKHFPLDEKGEETPTICCYCSVGGGALVISGQMSTENCMKDRRRSDHPIKRVPCPRAGHVPDPRGGR
jgi:formate dehydrogenase major subunit